MRHSTVMLRIIGTEDDAGIAGGLDRGLVENTLYRIGIVNKNLKFGTGRRDRSDPKRQEGREWAILL